MSEKSKHVSVRKIDNGYLRTESMHDGDDYSSKETFHKVDPGLSEARPRSETNHGKIAMAAAKKALK